MDKKKMTATIFLGVALFIAFISGKSYTDMHIVEEIVQGPGVSEILMLGDYFPGLKGTSSDTEIYVLNGEKPGGSMLVLGGTHPNEPSGLMTAVTLIENITVESGTLYVIPRTNRSAFTHNDPQEGAPQTFTIKTPNGDRWFRYGSRATNPIDQWPDPDVYIHAASGQKLSGSETRNLNRAYPGRPDGTITEKVAYSITEFIKTEKIDMVIDLHEASPEYPVVDAIVAHDNAMGIASETAINLQLGGIQIGLEPSPTNLRGLSHRELGDYTDTLAILMETTNPAQGRLRGKTSEELILTGKDKTYVKAGELGRLYVPFDESGHPLDERVARHLVSINELAKAYSNQNVELPITFTNIPDYKEVLDKGIGYFLNPIK